MPIFEFKCLACGEVLELLVMNNDEEVEMKCKKCDSNNLEKLMSTASHSVSSGSGSPGPSVETKKCASGSCHTYNIPGPTR